MAVAQPHLYHLQPDQQLSQLQKPQQWPKLQLKQVQADVQLRQLRPNLLRDLKVVARALPLPWKVCKSVSHRCLLIIEMLKASVSAPTTLPSAPDVMRHHVVPNISMTDLDMCLYAQHHWLYAHKCMLGSTKVTQLVRWALMLDVDAQRIQTTYVQGKGHTNPNHAKIWQGIFEQLPLVIMLGLIVLDALSVTAGLLRMTVKYTIEHAQKAMHCVLIVKKNFGLSNAMKIAAMIKTAVLSDRLQYHVEFVLSPHFSITQRSPYFFAFYNGFLHSGMTH